MFKKAQAFAQNERGASAVEYAFLAALIAVVIAAILPFIGSSLKDRFQSVVDAFK